MIGDDSRAGKGFDEAEFDGGQLIAATQVAVNLVDKPIVDFGNDEPAIQRLAIEQPIPPGASRSALLRQVSRLDFNVIAPPILVVT